MMKPLIRLALLLIVLFTAALLLIHAQPYDDHELRELLLPEGCPAPCFMGIRPGVTTMDEAMNILKSHKWVYEVHQVGGTIDWTWSDASPTFIDRSAPGRLQLSTVPKEKCCVGIMTFKSTFVMGDVQLLLGQPTEIIISRNDTGSYTGLNLFYRDRDMRFFTGFNCPINPYMLWQKQETVYIESKAIK
ncbi:MAG: hypothetical protein ABI970_22675 [Chloroflexota bacterium]